MTTINMLRGGPANGVNGDVYMQNMYPRPDYKGCDMAQNDGWENRPDSFHYVQRFNVCECWTSGAIKRAKDADTTTDVCGLEVGDEIPMVWVPNRSTIESFTLDIANGADGVILGVKRYSVGCDDAVISGATEVEPLTPPFTAIAATPLPGPVIDQAYLDALACNERVDLADFCGECQNQGCYHESWLAAPELVGGCEYQGQYLSLVIEALPADFDCETCCLEVHVGARVRVAHMGH